MILQTKEICQSFFDSKIVDSNKNTRNEILNIDENRSIASNAQTLITRIQIRFSFSLKSFFSITRQKVLKKSSKDKLFKSKKSFENLNQSFRFKSQEHEIFFESINEILQVNKVRVNTFLFILIVVKILQKSNHFAQQQRVKLLKTKTVKKLNNDVFSNANRINQFCRKRKLTKILTKKMITEKWYFIC